MNESPSPDDSTSPDDSPSLAETTAVYEEFADEYRECHDDRSVVAEQVRVFRDALDGDAVLDVGCGPGWESATFSDAGLSVVGVDLAPAFLEMARERAPDAAFVRGDMRRLCFDADSFDGVWACASVHHLPYDRASEAFAEFYRVLRPGGVALLTCKRGTGETTGETFGEDDRRRLVRYAPDRLRTLAEDAGFAVERLDATDSWNELLVRR